MITPISFSKFALIVFCAIFFVGTEFSSYFTGIISVNNIYDLKRILVIGAIVTLSAVFVFVKSPVIFLPSRTTLWVLILTFSIGVVSAYYSKHIFWSAIELFNFLMLIYLFFIFTSAIASLGRDKVIEYLFYFSVAFLFCISIKFILLLYFHFLDSNRPNIHSLLSGFMNVRFFNQLQVMLIPILFLSFYSDSLKKFRPVTLFILSVMWMMLLQSESRGALLALGVATLFSCFSLQANYRRQFITPIIQSLCIGTVMWLVFIIILPIFVFGDDIWQLRTTSSGRFDLWAYILNNIPDHLWLGYGPMSFAWAEGRPLLSAHPHNYLMQILYEFGVVVFLLVTLFSAFHLHKIKINIYEAQFQESRLVVLFSLVSVWIYSLFDGVIVMPLSQVFLTMLFALNISGYKNFGLKIKWRIIVFMGGLLLAEILMNSLDLASYSEKLFPRFWLHGVVGF
ncbi:O-antigen ligase family protein [Shewanella sp. A25]|nr:O-antigen ligase family protein [Shewanella shenzhenensis]